MAVATYSKPLRTVGALALLVVAATAFGAGPVQRKRRPVKRPVAAAVQIVNSREGRSILTASAMVPGRSESGEVTITNRGSAPARLYLTSSLDPRAGALADALLLTVEDRTSVPARVVYAGSLAKLGTPAVGRFAPGVAHRLRLTVRLGAESANSYQGTSVAVGFRWFTRALPAAPAAPFLRLLPVRRRGRQSSLSIRVRCALACSATATITRGRATVLQRRLKLTRAGRRTFRVVLPLDGRHVSAQQSMTLRVLAKDARGRRARLVRRIG